MQRPEADPCTDVGVAVLVVHGIGTQEPGDTQEQLGGAIAEFWTRFDDPAEQWKTGRCDLGHIHLRGPLGDVGRIDEGYWDDLLPEPPRASRLVRFLLAAAPLMILATMVRAPRLRGGPVRFPRSVGMWIFRLAFALLAVLAVEAIVFVVGILAVVFHRVGILRRLLETLALTAGDVYGFARDRELADRFVRRVVESAQALADGCDHLVVVAHSQGGAITYEAVQQEDWPDLPTSVITLGSGHKRLTVLRWLRKNLRRRLLEPLWWVLIIYAISLPPSDIPATQAEAIGRLAGRGLVAGLFVFAAYFLIGRSIKRAVRAHTDRWLDIWATRDLVPDGPAVGGIEAVEVANRMSFVLDHTTYHENAPQVIAEIVQIIHPDRLRGSLQILDELRRRRDRRVRGSRILRELGLVLPRNRFATPHETLALEFSGRFTE